MAAREIENQRLRRVEAAASVALDELDALIGKAEGAGDTALSQGGIVSPHGGIAAAQGENDDPQALRTAERG